MTIDKDERESLHFILDYLLNARAYLEKIDPQSLAKGAQFYETYSFPKQELFRNASIFLRRVLGTKLHQNRMSLLFDMELEEDSRNAVLPSIIADAFRAFLPLFMRNATYEGETFGDENIEKIINDLMGIYWGDEPRFFATAKKQQGSHKRPYRLAKLRLAALEWDKYLETVGLAPYERHSIVSKAFRTEWDTIRKWENRIAEQFGLSCYPPMFPDTAKSEYSENPEAVLQAIQRAGDAYWLERSTASSGRKT